MWNQTIWRLEILLGTIVAALLKTKYNGRFVQNKRYQETGKEYFTIVQMIVKDDGYWYFAARAIFVAWLCPPSPPSASQTHQNTHTPTKRTRLPNDLCPSYPPAHTTLFPILITTNAPVFLSHNYPKIRENLFHKSWKFTWTDFNCTYVQHVQEIEASLSHNMNELAPRALWFLILLVR